MRYAVYAVLVLVGVSGLLAGLGLTSRASADQEMLWLLIGTVALGAVAVIMAIEHATSVQTRTLLDILRYQQKKLGAGGRPLEDL